MSALHIFRWEVRQRALMLLLALALGLTLRALLWLWPGRIGADHLEVLAVTVTLGFPWITALVLGAEQLPIDLEQRRFSFYLSRPLAAGAVLAGRAGAALALATTGALVILGAHGRAPGPGQWPGILALALAGAGFLYFLFQALSTLGRAHSPWSLLTLVGAVAVTAGLGHSLGRFRQAGCAQASLLLIALTVGGLLVVLVLAAWLQVTRGGSQLQRGHRYLVATLVAGGLALAGLGQGFTAWVLSARPTQLRQARVEQAAEHGPWLILTGQAHLDHRLSFLFNCDTGRYLALPAGATKFMMQPSGQWASSFLLSPDGQWAAWLLESGPTATVVTVDLTQPQLEPRPLAQVSPGSGHTPLCFGPNHRLAVTDAGTVVVWDLVTRQALARLATDPGDLSLALFTAADRMRFYVPETAAVVAIHEWDLTRGQDLVTGQVANLDWLGHDPGRDALLGADRSQTLLCDGRSGQVRARIPVLAGTTRVQAQFLADGSLALLETGRQRPCFRHFDAQGQPLGEFEPVTAPGSYPYLRGEAAAGHLQVTSHTHPAGGATAMTASLADLGQSRLLPMPDQPLTLAIFGAGQRLRQRYPVGGIASRLAITPAGALVLRQPDGGWATLLPTFAR